MGFDWDALRPYLTVPYIPTIGPVHPSVLAQERFEDILTAAGSGRFLPYDKDRRWSPMKQERVLVEDIEQTPGKTLVPTLTRHGHDTVKVHVYSCEPDALTTAAVHAKKLCAAHDAKVARVVWFLGPEQPEHYVRGTRVQLKDFAAGAGADPGAGVQEYEELPGEARAGFAEFAERMADDGFAFLYQRMKLGHVGSILTVSHEGKVAGAIGPMETMVDAIGQTQLLPQYFGVLPEFRGHGYGRALWRAAMHWGHRHGAAYQLLQTEVGGASDRLCAAEGLASLGFVCSVKA
ncbi:GNAT superfamily N-acetyltransferase [Streptomyces griseochromogenes]|uniref:Acetyltransferase n=1 Tax=Streptomyces griseochromogenes TaxID=68214 RepID=A0A1B1B7X0_9ACTN|nr:GNAT family N-acetyltransferase [Streptomyces griseochromogenes]ANP54887.1 acetyltransferase [Streptomyces griseochromogenes]MBP2048526.1 GNAT superfamily N-acetyltransferase [Streptomyces griseochromogenes]